MKSNLNSFWADLIIEELIRCGADHFCIAPGSRSTPLVVAAARNAKAQCVVCYDERVAGFYALGYAKAANKPAVVITTSGTAVANLLPAVTEAHSDYVPMLLLTADRPEELSDTGANQTLQQTEIFAGFLRWRHTLPCPSEAFPPEAVLTTIDQAVFRTRSLCGGPVHLNCRYREPLEPCEQCVVENYTAKISNWSDSDAPFTSYQEPQVCPNEKALDEVVEVLGKTERGLLVIGALKTNFERKQVLDLAQKLSWPVYADITSGVRLTGEATSSIRYFDQQVLSSEFNQAVRPDAVLHFGGRTTSKRLDQFARAISGRIDNQEETPYLSLMRKLSTRTNAVIERRVKSDTQLSEPFVARHLSAIVPHDSCLFLSNSMPVRDMDLYGVNNRGSVFSTANRGVSGIDGIISTAIGITTARRSPTTLVIGDIAFLYDLNALAFLTGRALPIIVVVLSSIIRAAVFLTSCRYQSARMSWKNSLWQSTTFSFPGYVIHLS
jgi:2-succinyl-5-enolpyruvyl-6-hydroxy-3-cyclohexene-1-carboxylate synthase